MKYDKITFGLHLCLATAVSAQLVLGAVMDAPRPGVPPGDVSFSLHRLLGIWILAVLLVHWVWQLSGKASNGMRVLFPWLFPLQRAALAGSVKRLIRGEVKKPLRALAGTVQGVGLLVATLMATTGLTLFIGMPVDGAASPTIAAIRHLHSYGAVMLSSYLAVHLSLIML